MCVQVCVECTSDTVVMYLRGIMGGSHCFSIHSYIIIIIICALLLIFVRLQPQLFTSFVLFFVHFSVKQFMQQYSKKKKTKTCLQQPSDVKTPKPLTDTSMPKVMYIV